MAAITIAPRLENPANDVESVVTGGYVQIRISAAVSSGGQWLLPIWSDPIPFAGSPVVVQLDPQAVIPYEAFFHLPSPSVVPGEGDDWLDFTEFRKVVDATARAWDTLEQVGAPGSAGAIPGDIAARLTALESTVTTLSGGASTVEAITNMTPYMRLLNKETNAAAALANLTAAPLASPALTGNPTAPTPTTGDNDTSIATTAFVQNSLAGSGLSFASAALTGNPTAPTPTAGDNDTSIATTAFVNTAIAATLGTVPLPFYATSTSYAGRPVTTRPVWWMSWDVAPPATTGTTSSGTGPVPNLDVVFLALGVVPG